MAQAKKSSISNSTVSTRRGAPVKFPDINKMTAQHPFAFIDRDKVLALYNIANGKEAKNISPAVVEWFEKEARANGWEARQTVTYGTGTKAGFVLWVMAHTTVTVVAQYEKRHRGH